ncbi:MAG: hypothetical protein M3P40_02450 [Actinomycetota bacterium]|nr:hypothetical protein [Actinomycetota bacterium]
MANTIIENVFADALKTLDERLTAVTEELDQQREQYRKAVQPLEDELGQLQDARARLTGERPKGRASGSDGGSGGSRRPRGQVREAIFAAVSDRPGSSAAEIATVVGGSKASITSSLQKYAADGALVKEKRPEGGVGFRLA